ncbi:hypothetical protein RHGRI_005788 [Rhododendron griersonianum]|uniref:Uncharacterized protein n=1 Tax=Rhododendron griersonianum TaxID=479676 RepID=A0AAV6LEF6_9ERIC|nr:hypothetical protein RHGRI_005788 [Rhododendron griersonianum]
MVSGAALYSVHGSFSSRIIEATGFRLALATALEWDFSHVIVKGMQNRYLTRLTGHPSLLVGILLLDCVKLASKFSSCSHYVPRWAITEAALLFGFHGQLTTNFFFSF